MPDDIEKIHHDSHKKNVTAKRFWQAKEFINACECVAVRRLKQGQTSEGAGNYLGELAARIAESLRKLTEAGDIALARRLPPIVATMQLAESSYGRKLTNKITKQLRIGEILKKNRPIDLIQSFAALHPDDWAELGGIEDGPKLLREPEEKLSALLLSEETWTVTHGGVESEEKRKHRLAEIIENMQAIRETQQPIINLFVENLWHGRLWSGPNGTFEDCNWPTRPPRADVKAWMKLIMPYLKQVTDNDPMKLLVFRKMLAARSSMCDGEKIDADKGARLATAPKRCYIWSQIRSEIAKAWTRMEKQSRKPVLKKSA